MKKHLHRANRGIVLGAVALFALCVYIIAGHMSFALEKPVIRDMILDYIIDCEAVNHLPEEHPAFGVPDDFVDLKQEAIRVLTDKYFSDDIADSPLTRQGLTDTLNDCLLANIENSAYIERCGLSLSRIDQLRRNGGNAAIVSFTVKSDVVASPDAQYFNMFSSDVAMNIMRTWPNSIMEMTFLIMIVKIDDAWYFSNLLEYTFSEYMFD